MQSQTKTQSPQLKPQLCISTPWMYLHGKTWEKIFFSCNLNFKAAYTICRSRFGFYIFTPSAVRCHLQRPSSPSLLKATPTSPSPAPFVPSSLLSLSYYTHHCRRAHRGCDISSALPPPRSPLLPPPPHTFFLSWGRLGVLYVLNAGCVHACVCVRVTNEEKLEGRGGSVRDDGFVSLARDPRARCHRKGHPIYL